MQKNLRFTFILSLSFFIGFQGLSQDVQREVIIKKINQKIKLDGLLDDTDWKTAQIFKNFQQNRPYDSSLAVHQTQAQILFDDNFIYVAATVFEKRSDYIVQSLKRDFQGGTSDVFTLNFDTFKDRLNGYNFAVSPLNVQREGLVTSGDNIDNAWDNKWYSAVKNYEDFWTVEIAIPFKTLRYKVEEGQNTWRMNFGRLTLKYNETSTFQPVPRNFRPNNLAYAATLIWETPPPKVGVNISVIPYLTSGLSQDNIREDETYKFIKQTQDFTKNAGFDAKIAVTPSLNLDLTVNPDFSQVEVDKQVTNLSRFELFFPERRQFFLENADLFGQYGFPNSRPFFSRRIGITQNPVTGLAQRVPILFGARLSGKLDQNWRIGLLNMQTQKVNFSADKALSAANYSTISLQRKVFKRSTMGVFFVDKENFRNSVQEKADYAASNRVGGAEFNFYSEDGKWETETYFHQSATSDTDNKDAKALSQFVGYNDKHLRIASGYNYLGKNYRADVGYVPRRGIQGLYNNVSLLDNPKGKLSKVFQSYAVFAESNRNLDLAGKLLDKEDAYGINLVFKDFTEVAVGFYDNYTKSQFNFDPTNSGKGELKANVPYRFQGIFTGFELGNAHKVSADFNFFTGGFYSGTGASLDGSIGYRWQPYGVFSLGYNFSRFQIPEIGGDAKLFLLGPKAELSFSRTVFFSTFFQYNTQANNFNINSRLQWRFQPVSDLFLVYTDNYFAENITNNPYIRAFVPKNRAIVMKITYWLNV